mgnify:CR=1 FL=1
MKNILKLTNTIFRHPLNKDNIYRAFFRFVIFNLKTGCNKSDNFKIHTAGSIEI